MPGELGANPMKTFTYHIDPGHGWLEVDWTDLKALELNPTDFSRYSYRKHNTFYLEEDCDATKFVDAFEAKHGDKPRVQEKHIHGGVSSPIRNLNPIR
jgi:hypothetical protein